MRPEVTGQKIPLEERFGVTVNVAAEWTGVSKSTVYELFQKGELAGKIIGGRHIVLVPSLLRLLGNPEPPMSALGQKQTFALQ